MPTYTCTLRQGRLSTAQKAHVAAEITRVHHSVTGAAGYFAQVLFHELEPSNLYVAGKPLASDHIYLHGQIRAGRSQADHRRLLLLLHQAVAMACEVAPANLWVHLVDVPASHMIEHGHVLPEPGGEARWYEDLPEAERQRLRELGS